MDESEQGVIVKTTFYYSIKSDNTSGNNFKTNLTMFLFQLGNPAEFPAAKYMEDIQLDLKV